MKGSEIKSIAKERGVCLWRIARAYGVADSTFSKYLRDEFNETETKKILAIIDELTKESV